MARVALINPGGKKEFALTEPLSLLYLGAYLEDKGVSVQIIDEVAGDNIRKSLRDGKPEVIGITAFTSSAERAYDISDMCRSKGILTVLGGCIRLYFQRRLFGMLTLW